MNREYHVILTKNALRDYFEPAALDQIIQANISQDKLIYQLGFHPHFHFDNDKIDESIAYVASLHKIIIDLSSDEKSGELQREAFGRLCHAVQDFYAHSNFVDIWLKEKGGLNLTAPGDIDGLDEKILTHPHLKTGDFKIWRDFIYHIPFINDLARKVSIPKFSHEEMNLDTPNRGIRFRYAMIAAQQRTLYEYNQVIDCISQEYGDIKVKEFRFINQLLDS